MRSIDGVMVNVLVVSAVDRGFELLSGQTGLKSVFAASLLCTQYLAARAKTGWLLAICC
jgi:hypothetical protein